VKSLVPKLSPEDQKTNARMMGILIKKLAERGLAADFGTMGAILQADAEAPFRFLLNTKAVKEARLLVTEKNKPEDPHDHNFLCEHPLRALQALTERDDTGFPLGTQETWEAMGKSNPQTQRPKKSWKACVEEAAHKEGVSLTKKEKEAWCLLALYQKVLGRIRQSSFLTGAQEIVCGTGDPISSGTWERKRIAQALAKILDKTREDLDPETLEAISAEALKDLCVILWKGTEDNLLCALRTGQTKRAPFRFLRKVEETFKEATQRSQALAKKASLRHDKEFAGTKEDPVPLSPAGFGAIISEILQGSNEGGAQVEYTPGEGGPEEGEHKIHILLDGEILTTIEGHPVHCEGIWHRSHLLEFLKLDSDWPAALKDKEGWPKVIRASDHLDFEDQIKEQEEFLKENAKEPEVLREIVKTHETREGRTSLIKWEKCHVSLAAPETKLEEMLYQSNRLLQNPEALRLQAIHQLQEAEEALTEEAILREESALRVSIAKGWTLQWEDDLIRPYRTPEGFAESPQDWWRNWERDVAGMNIEISLGQQAAKLLKGVMSGRARDAGTTGAILRRLGSYESPMYWVKKDFFRAAHETDLPDDLKFTDFEWPLPCGILFLEEGCLEVDGNPVGSITFAYAEDKNAGGGALYLPTPEPTEPLHNLITSADIIGKGHAVYVAGSFTKLDSTISAACAPNPQQAAIDGLIDRLSEQSGEDWDGKEIRPVRMGAKELARELPAIVAKLNLALASRPSALTINAEQEEKPEAKGKKLPFGIWEPNFIGQGYRIVREYEEKEGAPNRGGTKLPTHFRRGHVRNQAHGPAMSLRKILWIEPIIVGLASRREQRQEKGW
jgi:hypothetical protein